MSWHIYEGNPSEPPIEMPAEIKKEVDLFFKMGLEHDGIYTGTDGKKYLFHTHNLPKRCEIPGLTTYQGKKGVGLDGRPYDTRKFHTPQDSSENGHPNVLVSVYSASEPVLIAGKLNKKGGKMVWMTVNEFKEAIGFDARAKDPVNPVEFRPDTTPKELSAAAKLQVETVVAAIKAGQEAAKS